MSGILCISRLALAASAMAALPGALHAANDVATAANAQSADTPSQRRQVVVVVIGAEGTPEYGAMFQTWAESWRDASQCAAAEFVLVGSPSTEGESDLELLGESLSNLELEKDDLLWVVLIGHGTFDGHAAKFNLRGPDLTAAQLDQWLEPIPSNVAVINCASSSAPFLNELSAEGRFVITATRSGDESNFARFGGQISKAINDPQADLDKDEQVSLLEAYLTACRRVQEFYDADNRLATEHALLDDNGDQLGTPADWFRGIRATKQAKEGASLDGVRAHQLHLVASDREKRMPEELRNRRDAIEVQLAALRLQKTDLGEEEYYSQLEPLMLELADLYRQVSAAEPASNSADDGQDASDRDSPAEGSSKSK